MADSINCGLLVMSFIILAASHKAQETRSLLGCTRDCTPSCKSRLQGSIVSCTIFCTMQCSSSFGGRVFAPQPTIPPKNITGLQGPTPVQTLLPGSFSLRLLLHKIGIKYKAMVPQYTLASLFSSQWFSRKMIFEPVLQTEAPPILLRSLPLLPRKNEIRTVVTACFSTRNGRNRDGFQYHDEIMLKQKRIGVTSEMQLLKLTKKKKARKICRHCFMEESRGVWETVAFLDSLEG